MEIQRYLKTDSEFDRGKEVIQWNADIIQPVNTSEWGHLCLFVLKSLGKVNSFKNFKSYAALWSIYTR